MKYLLKFVLLVGVVSLSPVPKRDIMSQSTGNNPVNVDTVKSSPLVEIASKVDPIDSAKILDYKQLIDIRDKTVKKIISQKNAQLKVAKKQVADQRKRAEYAESQVEYLQKRVRDLNDQVDDNFQKVTILPATPEINEALSIVDSSSSVNKKNNIFAKGWRKLKGLF